MKLDMSEFAAMTEAEQRAYLAEHCSTLTEDEVAAELITFFLSIPDGAPSSPVLKQVASIVGDIRAGERLRLSRLQ